MNPVWSLFTLPIGMATSSALQNVLSPVDRWERWRVDAATPNKMPPWELFLNQFWRGGFDNVERFASVAKYHGISLLPHPTDPGVLDGGWDSHWRQALRYSLPLPNVDTIFDMWRSGYMDRQVSVPHNLGGVDEWLERAGVIGAPWQRYVKTAPSRLSVEMISDMRLTGYINDAEAKRLLSRERILPAHWQDYALNRPAQLTPDVIAELYGAGLIAAGELPDFFRRLRITDPATINWLVGRIQKLPQETLFALVNRGRMELPEAEEYLKRNGLFNARDRREVLDLRKQIPGYSDIVRIAVKEGWNDEVSARFGYDEEFPPEFAYWMGKQGYNWAEDVVTPDGRRIPGKTWAQLLWRSHWANLAPGQAFEMEWRLNADNIWRWQQLFPGIEKWTQDDVAATLKINDYPSAYRDRLQAISYQRLGTRVVARIARAAADNEEFTETHLRKYAPMAAETSDVVRDFAEFQARDFGLAPDDAELMGDLVRIEYEKAANKDRDSRQKRRSERTAESWIALYKAGIIDRAQLSDRLSVLDWDFISIERARQEADNRELLDTFSALKSRIRSDYYGGKVAQVDVAGRLSLAGMAPATAIAMAQRWQIAFTDRRRQFSTSEILKHVVEGRIAAVDAIQRLGNLGWDNPDTMLILAQAQAQIFRNQARALQAQEKQRLAAAKQMQNLVKQQQRQLANNRALLAKMTPKALLGKLLKKDKVTQRFFRSRLRAMGFDDTAIDLEIISLGLEPEAPTIATRIAEGQTPALPPAGGIRGPGAGQTPGATADTRAGVTIDTRAGQRPAP